MKKQVKQKEMTPDKWTELDAEARSLAKYAQEKFDLIQHTYYPMRVLTEKIQCRIARIRETESELKQLKDCLEEEKKKLRLKGDK